MITITVMITCHFYLSIMIMITLNFFDYDYDYDYINHISCLQSRLQVIKIILEILINNNDITLL